MSNKINIKEILNAEKSRLYKITGVHGLGIGPKIKDGKITNELSIQVFVHKKKSKGAISNEELIPSEISGVKTDIIQAGPIKPLFDDNACPEINHDQDSYRPLVGGVQIQSIGGGRGTLSCIVRTRGTLPQDRMLSNQHVLYSGTASGPSCTGCTSGSRVGQPTASSSTYLGNVLSGKRTLYVDAALATLDAGTQWKPEIQDIGRIMGTETITTDILLTILPYRVRKRGAKTRVTRGVVISAEASGTANEGNYIFGGRDYENQLKIFPQEYMSGDVCFCASGDSGSLIVNDENKVVGLLFGSQEITVAQPAGDIIFHAGVACAIADVLNELQVDLVHSQPEGTVFTVPAAAAVAARSSIVSPAPASMSIEEHVQIRESVQKDIFALPNGEAYVYLFKLHENEIIYLINNNRRVATIWHRNGGPAILNQLIRAAQDKTRKLPTQIVNSEWAECVTRILDGFFKYGSAELKNDINKVKNFFITIGGLSYDQIISELGDVLFKSEIDAH